jgi:very-short-patch-repair endonuclease
MAIFFSFAPEDMNDEDMRARLVRWFSNPSAERQLSSLEKRCESPFEEAVLKRIVARGYQVLVQHEVGYRRIDLVVHDGKNRLAVECDGAIAHPPEQWEEDLRRQMALEQLGWTFFRIPGSEFYRNPDAAMEGLWRELARLSIRPGSPAAQPPSASTDESHTSRPRMGSGL